MNDDLMLILKHYGIERQSLQACEELGELIQAVSKAVRYNDKETLLEEIADVEVMIRQLMLYYDIHDYEIEAVVKDKILRQMERIQKEGENEL